MGRPRILLADDHTLVLAAFKKLLEQDFDVVGTVSDGCELVSFAPQLKPDVIVLDIGMAHFLTREQISKWDAEAANEADFLGLRLVA